MKSRISIVGGLVLLAGIWLAAARPVRGCLDLMEYGALMQDLPQSARSLADAVRQAPTTAPETAISARFKLTDDGQLLLSVVTAENGPTAGADNNNFKELSCPADSTDWCPSIGYLQEPEPFARAAEQVTLLSLSRYSLLDILAKAEHDQPGTPFEIAPVVRDHQAQFEVLMANEEGRLVTLHYNLVTGNRIESEGKLASASR